MSRFKIGDRVRLTGTVIRLGSESGAYVAIDGCYDQKFLFTDPELKHAELVTPEPEKKCEHKELAHSLGIPHCKECGAAWTPEVWARERQPKPTLEERVARLEKILGEQK